MSSRKKSLFAIVGPGMLVAATGVGAGDLATGAFTGSKLGVCILWAVVVGAALKFLLNEGLARWQLATGTTLLEGCVAHFGRPVQWFFLAYLLLWSFLVGSALMGACGVTLHAILPMMGPSQDKILYGVIHSAVAVILVRLGGYRLFEKIMGVCIAVMFCVVVSTAVALAPSWRDIGLGLIWPTIPSWQAGGLAWTVALVGGIGGTLTVLCYGYWIREEGREGPNALRVCRIDLATGYVMTAVFGLSMVVIGSRIEIGQGGGAGLIVQLAERMQTAPELGAWAATAKWAFLIGAWGAVFSSLFGVWQSVPYLFADFWALSRSGGKAGALSTVDTTSGTYRFYLYAIATVPTVGLMATNFQQAQLVYAFVGALFIPMLALALLVLNGQARLVGPQFCNSRLTSILLVAAFVFFLLAGSLTVRNKLLG